jgi:PleD family two-component response regulator
MPANQSKNILLLDDDSYFRQVIARIFEGRGYEVLEARNGRDATQLLSSNPIAFAIVDYRLPDTDGMTWISQIREAGYKFPIVFVSGTFCDARTFNWLRNILKVSIVLQKPIAPELFLQQLEGVVPIDAMQMPPPMAVQDFEDPPESITDGHSLQQYNQLLEDYPEAAAEAAAAEIADNTGGAPSEYELLDQLKQLSRKLQVESALASAKSDYAQQLPDEWQVLSTAISSLQGEPQNHSHQEDGIASAHRLRGTAGSLGFMRVSDAAARLEDLLKVLDVNETTESEVIWSEIFRALSDGETAVRNANIQKGAPTPAVKEISGKIILITQDKEVSDLFTSSRSKLPEIVVVETPANAQLRLKTSVFDGAIIDVRGDLRLSFPQVCMELRFTPGNESLPFAFLMGDDETLDEAVQVYLGVSGILHASCSENEMVGEINRLLAAKQRQKPKVLAVDDDEVLGKFIASVLTPEGISVSTLKEPINVLDKMEELKPDLVMLDVIMPGLSGYDVCRLLRSKDEYRDLSVLFLTSKSTPEGRAAAFKAGADDFLSKPVLTEELLARVRTQLDRSQAKKRHKERDELTGCLTRKVFLSQLGTLISDAKSHGYKASLYILEIEDLGKLVSQHGMLTEDQILGSLGDLILARFPVEVKRCRWSEKNLALCFAGEAQEYSSAAVEMLLQEIQGIKFQGERGDDFQINCSAGHANFPSEGDSIMTLFELAYSRLQANITGTAVKA